MTAESDPVGTESNPSRLGQIKIVLTEFGVGFGFCPITQSEGGDEYGIIDIRPDPPEIIEKEKVPKT